MRHLIPILLALAGPAMAQDPILPTLFDVARVAPGDMLNVRAAPDAGAAIIATLPPDATAIEVVAYQDGWSRINLAEGSGWVSARFLDPRPDVWPDSALPPGFACFGTEPFWSLRADGRAMTLEQPGLPDLTAPLAGVMSTGILGDPTRAVAADGLTLTATPQVCSDGMSDRLFGLRAMVVLGDGPRLLTGCCSIAP